MTLIANAFFSNFLILLENNKSFFTHRYIDELCTIIMFYLADQQITQNKNSFRVVSCSAVLEAKQVSIHMIDEGFL